MVVIIENLRGITAGSPMVGTPIILVWRPINPLHLSFLLFAISEVFGRNGMIQRSIIRPGLIGLQTKIIGVPTIGLPAVIPLRTLVIYIYMNQRDIELTRSNRDGLCQLQNITH